MWYAAPPQDARRGAWSKVPGIRASTIHKALNLTAGELHKLRELQLLEADLVLVDEVSMMDMVTTWCLFNALPPNWPADPGWGC